MKILFVCLGNICRSPMAEGIMKSLLKEHKADWQVDSAGTEYYHVGERPDGRAIRTCKKFGIDIADQRARRISKKDFETFDVIYALADDVLEEILEMKPSTANGVKLKLLMDEFSKDQRRSVPDPFYDDEAAFEPVFRMIQQGCEAILQKYAVKNH